MSRINCHSAFKHYEMFHSTGGDVINIGSNNTTIFNMGTGFGGGFWGGVGYGLGNAFGSVFSGMFGGGFGNMGGFGNFGGFGMNRLRDQFLAAALGFVPREIIDLLIAGIAVSIALAIIKFIRG